MPCAGNLPNDYGEEFLPAFKEWNEKGKASSTEQNLQQYYFLSCVASFERVPWYSNTNVTVPASYQEDMLSSEEVTALFSAYCAMYSEDNAVNICNLHVIIKRFSSICVGAEKYGSKAECRSLRSARILASWNGGNGQISATSPLSPGLVEYFMCHKLTIDGAEREHYFAYVRWFKKHPQTPCVGTFSTLSVWDGNNFEPRSCNSFLPVHRIHSLFTGGFVYLNNVKLMAVCPIPRCASIFY
ncbi:hypothetical protein P5673_027562 [Acropora cervicornis]|uniref:Uncharacterized protein n=1 Tax=Acropora cervicornis TaxID=6130 RepID=A0AAD9UVV0_ACRCE|nr:hypothetical protein P5673_027562 [Acropora cervicornis]